MGASIQLPRMSKNTEVLSFRTLPLATHR